MKTFNLKLYGADESFSLDLTEGFHSYESYILRKDNDEKVHFLLISTATTKLEEFLKPLFAEQLTSINNIESISIVENDEVLLSLMGTDLDEIDFSKDERADSSLRIQFN